MGLPSLKKRYDFVAVRNKGRSTVERGLILQVLRHPVSDILCNHGGSKILPKSCHRVGYTASKKIGGAVQRNYAKRRLRALAGLMIEHHGMPADYVLIARGFIVTRSFSDLRRDLMRAMKKLGVWVEKDYTL